MPRVKSSVARHKRRKRILKKAKGYRGGRSRLIRTATETVMRAEAFAFRDRRRRKRDFRRLWITRISAAARLRDITYSRFVEGLKKADVIIDRKILADIAVRDDAAFDELANVAKKAAA